MQITCANSYMGTVVVNTSSIDFSDSLWSGQYFTDYPITITAAANDGFEFLGWKGDVQSTAPTITVPVSGGLSLEAVFAPKE